jgi:hypothetical protein
MFFEPKKEQNEMLFRRKKVNLCTKGVQFEQKKSTQKKDVSHM